MGLFLTVLYIFGAYIAPQTIYGPLADMHIQQVIVFLALVFSLPKAGEAGILGLTQTWAVVGLSFCVSCSLIFNHWIGGAPIALSTFIPMVMSFFLIAMNCTKKQHLQLLVVALFSACAFIVYQGSIALDAMNISSPYLLRMVANEELRTFVIRFRGLDFLSDPNDLAQVMVSIIPLLFLFWKKGRFFTNLLFCYVPAGYLFYGMFQTHSRGSMVALMAFSVFVGRKKVGLLPAIVMGVVLFLGLSAAGFSGGRDVGAGDDRVAAWAAGLMLIKRYPIFGVGYSKFPDFHEVTAHNTFVVCAAELGLTGVYMWTLFMLVTVRNALVGADDPEEKAKAAQKKLEAEQAKQPFLRNIPSLATPALSPAAAGGPYAAASQRFSGGAARFTAPPSLPAAAPGSFNAMAVVETPEEKAANDAEVRRMSSLVAASFIAFLTAGWFLSRAYTMCLYVNAGIGAAVYKMALDRGIAPPPLETGEALKKTLWTVAILLVVVNVLVKFK